LTGHVGGRATSDALCYVCHDAVSIDMIYHQIKTDPTSGPNIPAGAHRIEYEIYKVTANGSNQPVVTFRILKDGSPVSFNAYTGADTDAAKKTYYLSGLLTGFTGSPSFLVAYSTTGGVDYDNIGNGLVSASLGQPLSVAIADLMTGKAGTIAASTVAGAPTGSYDATLVTAWGHWSSRAAIPAGKSSNDFSYSAPAAWPAGSKLRTVALQGYFTQAAGTNGIAAATARHARMVIKAVSGEARREVVDNAKCANCHDNLSLHGGNRVYNAQGCIVCHNPNIQESFNFKDFVHMIHSAQAIADNNALDWSAVVFPSISPSYCLACHKTGTYSEVPADAQPSTFDWTTLPAVTVPATAAAATDITIQTATDTLTSPFTAACISCHNTDLARAHAVANGGSILVLRPAYPATNTETCGICHGAGKTADPATIHRVLIF
jgi:OmcA/MtrC family decaheme c-type cytochrome